jgi:hypothetical protein
MEKDNLQLLQKTIKCLELIAKSLQRRPEDKQLVDEINNIVIELKALSRDTDKRGKWKKSIWVMKAIGIFKLIKEYIIPNLPDDPFDLF